MRIKSITIKNFRCFEEAEINFEKCHALVGENGAGKTAILEAINLATSRGQAHLNESDFNNKDKGEIKIEVFFDDLFLNRIPDGYTTQDIACDSIILSAHRREKASPGRALSEPIVVDRFTVPIIYSAKDQRFNKFDQLGRVNIPASVRKTENGYESPRKTGTVFQYTPLRLSLHNDTVNLPDIFYFDRDREDEAKIGFNSLLQKITKDFNWRYRNKWEKSNILSTWEDFYSLVIETIEDPKNSRIMRPVQEKMQKIIGKNFHKLELSLLELEQPFSKAFFSIRDDTNQTEQKKMGSGISILLAYFLLETISKLSKEEIIFLIDEPELHLHIQVQQKLFNDFENSPFQIIYTTQSDCFINLSEWRSINRFNMNSSIFPIEEDLDKQVEGKLIKNHLDEIKKWHQHKSIYFREDNQIFFSRKCLLVEGPIDKFGIPVLAKILNKDLEDITIISCNGKGKIPYYQLLCKAFGIPFYTLFDLDGKKIDDTENKKIIDWSDDNKFSSFSSTFERLIGINIDTEHKSSSYFAKLESIADAKQIDKEISDAIAAIGKWSLERNSLEEDFSSVS